MDSQCIFHLLILQTFSSLATAGVDVKQKRLFSISSSPLGGSRTKMTNQSISQPQLVSVLDSQAYRVTLLFQFSGSDSDQVELRLLYERVPHHFTPDLGKLDNPIVKYIQAGLARYCIFIGRIYKIYILPMHSGIQYLLGCEVHNLRPA